MPDPRDLQGSDADLVQGGLDVEAAFAAPDRATASRMRREAQSQQRENYWADWAEQPGLNVGPSRKTGGRSAIEMLTSRADGQTQDEPTLTENLWYPTEDFPKTGNASDPDPKPEGPLQEDGPGE